MSAHTITPKQKDRRKSAALRACVRCGLFYEPRNGKPGLCRDCRYVLPVEEHPRWTT